MRKGEKMKIDTTTQEYKEAFNHYRKCHSAMMKTEKKSVHNAYADSVHALNKICKGA